MVIQKDDIEDFLDFIKIPVVLIKDKAFSELSMEAKVLYSIMKDRLKLSLKNNWIDEKGAYIHLSIEELQKDYFVQLSKPTIIKRKKELVDFGLIELKKQFNKSDKIYVNRLSSYISKNSLPTEVKNFDHISKNSLPTEVKNFDSNQSYINQSYINRITEPDGAGANNLYSIEDAPENDLGIVHDWIFSEFGRYPTPFEIEDLKYFLQDHSKEVIKLAIKECVGNGKPYFKYLESILRDWKQKGLVTAELVENRQRPKRSSGKPSSELRLSDDGYNPRLGF
ncbi:MULTISPECIES: replication initiator protein A [Streptococcus]|uniref:DnaD domain protein n=1 Tax=Streptococcus pseudopneumoniae TaxID=257758 RepID=A0AAW4C8S4_9STRE|nr:MULTISPECIES: replication initiator protein A [Streptococcus]EHE04840.1 dnaD and phage-associated domain protein [Streptococcus pneumoniae GA16242]AEL11227.1 phage protein [Streptococcus pseudopneumoniae IS7493]EID28002.1 replication initiator protein A [Streptococcus pseudopneumoniae ATCC BAA-960 = CCUG 49455]ETE03469.1 replication initiation protein [Streptococcus pseudopneumoniae 22725]KPL40934.1 replication initiation protein [Streptococcus pseudopneumoniae]